ncbi:MAG: hypothetical protein HYY37_00010 [Candidatus Aenigmarchaeota archaeon]|nr:hypothetical protein [Candidatus Aenigmarchaeota archaeon]
MNDQDEVQGIAGNSGPIVATAIAASTVVIQPVLRITKGTILEYLARFGEAGLRYQDLAEHFGIKSEDKDNLKKLSDFMAELVDSEMVRETIFEHKGKIETWYKINNVLKNGGNISLGNVHQTFKKWFHLQDTNRVDIVLAVALSHKLEGTPLWLIIVSNSGDMKTEQIVALDDDGKTTKLIHKFTDKTLVNGFRNKEKHPDLAPKLNGKIALIPDMAEILQLHPNIKAQVWGQLRDLYDGFAGVQTGMGTDIEYKGLRVTLIGASTPAIDDQILIHQSLGTRELIYRPKEVVDIEKLMAKAWMNEEMEQQMRSEIKSVCHDFLNSVEIKDVEIPKYIEKAIKTHTMWLCDMRATASIDSITGELRGDVHSERPTRVLKQLKRLYICLKNLDNKYDDDKALEIIKETVEGSADQIRLKVLKLLQAQGLLTTSEVADKLRIGKKAAKTELCILWNLKHVNRHIEEATNSYGNTFIVKEEWEITNRH